MLRSEVVEFVEKEGDIFCVSRSACWEGKPFWWAESSHSVQFFFFFTPSFCRASLTRGLSLAGLCCCKGLFIPPTSLLLSQQPFLFILALHFSAYNDGAQDRKNIRCTHDTYFMQDDLEESAERKACQFKRSWLQDCSGLHDPHYGYSQGRPCILLRMNRVRNVFRLSTSRT